MTSTKTSMSEDIAGHLVLHEYCNARLKGKPTLTPTKYSLSCFDQTLPVHPSRRAGGHEPCRIADDELPYYSANGEYKHRIPKKVPSDYTRKGDGDKIKRGELHSDAPKAEPPAAGACKMRDNPPNTVLRKLYERGDLPVQIEHSCSKNTLLWKVNINTIDYHQYLPLFFDGVREKQEPYRFIAVKAVEDLLRSGKGKILPVIPQLIIPIKTALNTRDPSVINITLQLLCKLVESEETVGQALVPYYRQLLPVLNIFRNSIHNIGDSIDYAQQKKQCPGELVQKCLEILEKHGGEDAFVNIKYMVPVYESCLNSD